MIFLRFLDDGYILVQIMKILYATMSKWLPATIKAIPSSPYSIIMTFDNPVQ